MTNHSLRENWLDKATELLRPMFAKAGHSLPEKLRVSAGWPSSKGTAKKKRTIGQCWSPSASSDKTTEVFISPYLADPLHCDKGDAMGVLPTLVHEHVHAAVGAKEGHKGPFKTLARALGLEGKLTATHAGADLLATLEGIAKKLGPYPHARLDLTMSPVKKQSTRMVKCTCPECGFLVRTSRKWLEDVGEPHCPIHGQMNAELPKGGDDDDSGSDE